MLYLSNRKRNMGKALLGTIPFTGVRRNRQSNQEIFLKD